MAFRLFVSDLDDSLLNDASELSPRTLRALSALMRKGVYVVLASGRMVEAMLPYARQVQPNAPLIAYNGGMVYDVSAQKALDLLPVPMDAAREAAKMAEDMGIHIQAFDETGYYYAEDNASSAFYASKIRIPGRAVHRKLSEAIDHDLCKMLMVVDPAEAPALAEKFREKFAGRINCAISRPYYIECTGIGADKGAALKLVSERLGVKREEIIAFGDAQNDMPMLNYAGRGCAVANARREVLEQVRWIVPDNDSDGIAKVLEMLLEDGAFDAEGAPA